MSSPDPSWSFARNISTSNEQITFPKSKMTPRITWHSSPKGYRLLLRWAWLLLPHFFFAVLRVGVPHGDVRIQGGTREVLVLPDPQRQVVLPPVRVDSDRQFDRANVADRVEVKVPGESGSVAEGRGAEDRQDEVESLTQAVLPEGLSEVRILLLQVELAVGGVEESRNPDRGIDREPKKFRAGGAEIPLEKVVYDSSGRGEVRKEVPHRDAHPLRYDEIVPLRDGLENPVVRLVVDREDRPVERLDRVGDRCGGGLPLPG